MRAIAFTAIAFLTATAISGCSTRVADLTVASTKNFNLHSSAISTGKRVEGSDSVAIVLFPLGNPNLKTAIDRAVEKDRCAVGLSDVVINQEFFAFIFGYAEVNVKGNLIIDNEQPGCGGYAQDYRQQPPQNWQAPATSYSSRDQQLQQLQQQQGNLSYEEYQRRYRQIMGQ